MGGIYTCTVLSISFHTLRIKEDCIYIIKLIYKPYIKKIVFDDLEKCKSTDAITGESSLGVMPVVAIVTGACVMVVVVISAIIYKMRYVKFISF